MMLVLVLYVALLLPVWRHDDPGMPGSYPEKFLKSKGENFGGEIWMQNRTQFHKGHRMQRKLRCNHMRYDDYVVQAVIHELIHAYDDCRATNMDWRNPVHQACTEIRANHLSGDCHMMRGEFLRGNLEKIKGHEPECVKQRSKQSVGANHPPLVAKAAVEVVWDTCYNDTAPYAEVP